MTAPVESPVESVPQTAAPTASSGRAFEWPAWMPSVLFIGLLLVCWEAIVRIGDVKPFILPPPSGVAVALQQDIVSGALFVHGWVTLAEVLLGFAGGSTLGFVCGVLVVQYRLVERTLYPLLVLFQSMPRIAIAPLLIIWVGFGIESKVLVAALTSFFPMMVNVIIGLKIIEAERLELMTALSASRWQTLFMVRIPSAMPNIFAGLELAIVFSVIGAVVGEFTGAKAGLGYLMQSRTYTLDVAGIFSILVTLAFMGLALDYSVKLIGRRVVFWHKSGDLLSS